MKHKFPIDTPFQGLSENISIDAKANTYNYRYNVNHPKIRELYEVYKAKKGIPVRFPLSDRERQEFEHYVDKWLRRQA